MSVAALLSACQQVDQTLPFELDLSGGATVNISSSGGVVSLPPSFSIEFPSGSFSGSVSVLPMDDGLFPGGAGVVVPGTAYDITPADGVLAVPARISIDVPPELLEFGEEIRLTIALVRDDGSVATFSANYDLTNEILSAEVDELGPVAAVILADAIPVDLGAAPPLGGGGMSPPPLAPGGAALTSHGGVEFSAACSPDQRQCFSSGLVQVWADQVIRDRLGSDLYLVNATVDAHFDFLNFTAGGIPQTVVGEVTINGELRARINSLVTSDGVDDVETTGLGPTPTPTAVTFLGNQMTLAETTDGFNTVFEYGINGIGTTEMITLRIDADVEFDNGDGTSDFGVATVHIRLRR